MVEVQTEAPGMATESVEKLVTIPLESALAGLPRMTVLRSKSVPGLSSIQMFFSHGSDGFQIRQMIGERVQVAAASMPSQVKTPHVLPPLSSVSRVLYVGLKPRKGPDGKPLTTQSKISDLMPSLIRPKLLAVDGVANVSAYGEQETIFRVLVKPRDLRD